jgi:hypothetical protein
MIITLHCDSREMFLRGKRICDILSASRSLYKEYIAIRGCDDNMNQLQVHEQQRMEYGTVN